MDHDPSLQPPPPPTMPPSGGLAEPRLPWEERQQRGFFDALVETVRLLITAPKDAFGRLRQDGDLTSPILFSVIVGMVSQLFGLFWQMLLGFGMPSFLGGPEDIAIAGGIGLFYAFLILILIPVLVLIFLFIAAGIYHLVLHLLGGLDRSPMGFEGSLKVTAYAQTAGLASVVPFLGWLIAMVGTIILLVIGLTQVHRAEQSKAIIAVLVPMLLCCVCAIVMAILFGTAMAAAFAGMAAHG